MPPVDGARRPFALRLVPSGLPGREGNYGAPAFDSGLSPLWDAREDLGGQWVALGVGWGASLYAPDGLADAAGDPGMAQSGVSSPDPGQGRAVSSDAVGRGFAVLRGFEPGSVPRAL